MADAERQAQGCLRADDGRSFLQLHRRRRYSVHSAGLLCGEPYPPADVCPRLLLEADIHRNKARRP